MMDLCHESSRSLAPHTTYNAILLLHICTYAQSAWLGDGQGVETSPIATKCNVFKA